MAPARPVVGVAASGGRDSTALLHATVRAAKALGLDVVALHVHHGLNPQADAWLRHVCEQCARWRRAGWPVRLQATRLAGAPASGQSVEAWARAERYAALTRMAEEQGAGLVLLAHHRRDQAETVMLQALRGAGPAGLAAMPAYVERAGLAWARPWLKQSSEALCAYVSRHRLSHIEDDSNMDLRFDRNRLRLQIWPALLETFPHAEASLAVSARACAEMSDLVGEVATDDLAHCLTPDGNLRLEPWSTLTALRRSFALRAWLQARLQHGVSYKLMQRLAAELPDGGNRLWPAGEGAELRLYRGVLRCVAAPWPWSPTVAPWHSAQPLALDTPGHHALPDWGGVILVSPVERGGLDRDLLRQAQVVGRCGGEQFQASPRGLPRSLKKQFQAAGLPAWQRDGPLLVVDGRLIWVSGLGPDARAIAPEGRPQCQLTWVPAAGAVP